MTYLRVARPTDDLDPIVAMYKTGLDLQVVAEFRGHDGFDGVVLSRPDLGYQIEFTHQAGHSVGKAPTKDNLLVFYHPENESWEQACERMSEAGFEQVPSWNPYWDVKGRTFEDPEGYRVVLQNARWP